MTLSKDLSKLNQTDLEELFSKKSSKEYLLGLVANEPLCQNMKEFGTELLQQWIESPSSYQSKADRKESLSMLNIGDLIDKVICDVLMIRKSSTLASCLSKLGQTLGFADTHAGITLAGEILAVLQPINLYSIGPLYKGGQWHVMPKLSLNNEERTIAERAMFIPPSLIPPTQLKNNRSSGYAKLRGESLILGGGLKHHENDICLEFIQSQNNIPLRIASEFIDVIEEEYEIDLEKLKLKFAGKSPVDLNRAIIQHAENFDLYKDQQYDLLDIYEAIGSEIYITNKVDNRGRVYSQGHHLNPMGNSYKKSMLDLAAAEKITVPENFFVD